MRVAYARSADTEDTPTSFEIRPVADMNEVIQGSEQRRRKAAR